MKKRLAVLAVVVLVLAGIMLILNRQSPPPAPIVAVGFLGFTNSGARLEAIFGISNPPNSAVSLHSVTLKEASGGSSPRIKDRGYFSWSRRELWGLHYAIGVDTTNEPLRVVFEFRQPAVGARRMVEHIKEFLAKLKGNERIFFTGRKFFVTNETCVVRAPL